MIVTSEGLCPQAQQTQIKDNSNIIAGGLKAKSKDKNLRGARRKDSSMKAMGLASDRVFSKSRETAPRSGGGAPCLSVCYHVQGLFLFQH